MASQIPVEAVYDTDTILLLYHWFDKAWKS